MFVFITEPNDLNMSVFITEPDELRKYCESVFEFRKITVNKFK